MKRNRHKLVRIDWLDSKGITAGWEFREEMAPLLPCKCFSVGFLIDDSADYKTIVQTIDDAKDNAQVMGRMSIPTCAIDKIVKLCAKTHTQEGE